MDGDQSTGGLESVPGYYLNARPEVTSYIPRDYTRVLEVGCGGGAFRANLRSSCEVWGVEPERNAAARAEKVLSRVLVGTLDAVASQLPRHYFDLVICNDVIEHTPDHDAFLTQLRQFMVADAHLLGSVPNVRCISVLTRLLVEKDWAYCDEGILDRTHLRFFTEKSFRRALSLAGYALREWHGINPVRIDNPWGSARSAMTWTLTKTAPRILGSDTRYRQFAFLARNGAAYA